jgi:hypothetical protein
MRYIFRNIIVLLLISLVGYQYYIYNISPKFFKGNGVSTITIPGYNTTNTVTDTVYKEIYFEVENYKPIYITRVDTVKLVLPMDVDTTQILFDYFFKYTYIDTLSIPGLGNGYLTDIITQNRIYNRSIIWDYKIPTIIQRVYVTPTPKNNLWIGGNIRTIGGDFINSIGASTLLQTKNNKIYGLDIGIGANPMARVRPYLQFGYYWKITE